MRTSFALAAAVYAIGARAQNDMGSANDLSETNNVTSLEGTWSSNPAVITGGDFCNPVTQSFTAPENTGISYSFTNDGYFEEAHYQYDAFPKDPRCIAGKMFWQHGKYKFDGDQLLLTPWADGLIQVQNACAEVNTAFWVYKQEGTYKDWKIEIDPGTANYVLKLNAFDGAKMAPLFLQARPPNMLPTQPLRGTNETGQTISRRRRGLTEVIKKRSDASAAMSDPTLMMGVGGALAAVFTFSLTLF